MKRIGLYIPNLSSGGAERVVSRLSYILSDDYEIFIILNEEKISYEYKGHLIDLDIPSSHNFIIKLFLPIKRALKLKIVKRNHKLDCVISFLTNANIINAISRTDSTATILSVRNYTRLEKESSNLSKVKDKLMKFLYKKADKIISVSKVIEMSLIEDYFIPTNKIKTIYNPYNVEEITKLSNMPICNNEHKEFLNNGNVFVTMGRLEHQKGFWHIIKALSLIANTSDSKLLIIGRGSQEEKINKLIKEYQLDDKVLLIGHQQNPYQYISKCYAYVLTSLFEGFPNALVEAMACGCPVIAVDCKSGPREILFNNLDLIKQINNIVVADYGIIIPSVTMYENWNSDYIEECEIVISNAMNLLVTNEELRNKLSVLGKIRAESFNYKKCGDLYCEVIEDVY